jgi:hypothetical protein
MTAPPSEPAFPPGDLRRIILHWTAGDYGTVYRSYHICIALAGDQGPVALVTHDLRANMRDVRQGAIGYAAHTSGRNSYAIGLAICAMRDATPQDFGSFPLRPEAIDLCCATAARLAAFYAIPVDPEHVATHAECALADGYFGCSDDQRWDIARLAPSPEPLDPDDARRTGDVLRAMIRACQRES